MLRLTDNSTPPHNVRVRRAGPPDIAALGALHAEAISERLGHRGGPVFVASIDRGQDPAEISRSFALHTLDDHVEVLVAELTTDTPLDHEVPEPLGHAVIRFAQAESTENQVAVIEELYVTPSARNVGLGSALLDSAKHRAAARGCTGLDAVALPGDRATKNFFEDHAMVARAIIVHAEVEPHPEPIADTDMRGD